MRLARAALSMPTLRSESTTFQTTMPTVTTMIVMSRCNAAWVHPATTRCSTCRGSNSELVEASHTNGIPIKRSAAALSPTKDQYQPPAR